MTPAQKLQQIIENKRRGVEILEAEIANLLNLQRELGFEMRKPNGHGGAGRKRDPERHNRLIAALTNAAILGATMGELSEASGYGLSSMQTKIKKMHKAGEVERVSTGRYRLKE